jgi:hypothetical protein
VRAFGVSASVLAPKGWIAFMRDLRERQTKT